MFSKEQSEMLYLPVFFNWYEITEEFSDADFGLLLRTLLNSFSSGNDDCSQTLPKRLRTVYKFMYDNSARTIATHKRMQHARRESGYRRHSKKSEGADAEHKGKPHLSGFSPDEAFKIALERSYKN